MGVFSKKGFLFPETSAKTSPPAPREENNMDSVLFHRDAEMPSARPFHYVPELEKMIISRHHMKIEENKITFQREVVAFLTGFIGRISMTYGHNKASKIMSWVEKIIRKDKLGVWRLKRDGFSDITLPFNSQQDAECLPELEISRYRNFFNYMQKLVSKYDPVRHSEWNERVERLDALARPVPLRTATVQGAFLNISYFGAVYGHHRFDYAYEMVLRKDEWRDLIKEIRNGLAKEIRDLNVDFMSMVAFGKTNVTDGRKILNLFEALDLSDSDARKRASDVVERFAELYHPTRVALWRHVMKRMDLLDNGHIISAAVGNYVPLPKSTGSETPVSFLNGIIEKDILGSLHGIGRDESGQEKYPNGIFIENILKCAQGGVDSDGRCKKVMVLTEAMPYTDTTRVCCGCARFFKADKNLQKCGGCKISYYCSVKCQKLHWKAGHGDFCTANANKHAEMRPLYKGMRAIERLLLELGEHTKAPNMNMFFNSRLDMFCEENEIKADTFMVLPGANLPIQRDADSKHISIAFFQSQDIIEYLNYDFKAVLSQIRNATDSEDYNSLSPSKEMCKITLKGISDQIDLLRSKKDGEVFVMGSFSSCALAINKIDTKAWERV